MERNVMIEEISDGKYYTSEDLVKADAHGCKGCSWCCENMCDTIFLDPYDLYSVCKGLGKDFTALMLEGYLDIGLYDLISMPHIKDNGAGCGFLSAEKRCTIHSFRPGICRLFPLGRFYHDDTFSYILQTHECRIEDREEVKVRDWLEIEELEAYEEYVLRWHTLVKNISEFMKEPAEPGVKRNIHVMFLKKFFETPYDLTQDFFPQIYARIKEWEEM
ncbi:MAG: YkgJ family cysteine cluster protein [Lachnospiraceae bacterium]|nr:YkgJ family cysteine cluster protein [Lachnospiraceae bacterium]